MINPAPSRDVDHEPELEACARANAHEHTGRNGAGPIIRWLSDAHLRLAAALLASMEGALREACGECRTPAESGTAHGYSCPRHRGLFMGLVTPDGWIFEGRGECRSCRAKVGWASNASSGKRAPFDPDGTSHFATCPEAGEWRKPSAP